MSFLTKITKCFSFLFLLFITSFNLSLKNIYQHNEDLNKNNKINNFSKTDNFNILSLNFTNTSQDLFINETVFFENSDVLYFNSYEKKRFSCEVHIYWTDTNYEYHDYYKNFPGAWYNFDESLDSAMKEINSNSSKISPYYLKIYYFVSDAGPVLIYNFYAVYAKKNCYKKLYRKYWF